MKKSMWLVRPVAVAVSSCFGIAPLWANPTGPQVMSGTANIQGLGTSSLKVTNSPSAIIHWQGFSIGAGQVTNFVQQSASSAVLNRVVGADISQIQGQLLSNGRVFLINPAGIIIGAGGVINTAGFVGSTLQMQDGDFLAGKLKFQSEGNAGSIINNGWIRAGTGGNIVLVAPNIQNNGLIQTEGGQLVLAAGRKMTIGSLDLEGVQFEIQAPADSVLNVGQLLANGGAVGVFAGTLRHTGDIRANALVRDEGGRVVLKAQGEITIAGGSTISADGKSGGDILIQSGSGKTTVGGNVSAPGFAGRGGDIKVLGERVSLVDNAYIDASGTAGGGQIRIGGDYQGNNAAIQNASNTFVGPGVTLRADAEDVGTGGRVIVWSDKATQYHGNLSARGGRNGGNGGFAEVSGKTFLAFRGGVDLGASKGLGGDLLLDPLDLYVDSDGGLNTAIVDESTDFPSNAVTVSPAALAGLNANVTLFASRYMRINSNVTLGAGHSFTATVAKYDQLVHAPDLPGFPNSAVLEGSPQNRLDIAADITTNGGAVNLFAPAIESIRFGTPTPLAPRILTNGGAVNIVSSGSIRGQNNSLDRMVIDAGSGAVRVESTGSNFQIGAVSGGSFTGIAPVNGFITGAITTTGPVVLDSTAVDMNGNPTGSSIQTGAITSNAGNVTANAFSFINTGLITSAGGSVTLNSQSSSVTAGGISSGGGAIDLTGQFGVSVNNTIDTSSSSPVNLTAPFGSVSTRDVNAAGAVNMTAGTGNVTTNGFTIDTPGAVTLGTTNGNITATVNNAASLKANAARSNSNGNVNATITSNAASGTALNATEITATQSETGCNSGFNCGNATVTINANGTGGVNLGTVTAKANVTPVDDTLGEQVTVTASQGNIRALSAANKVTAANVTLRALIDGMGVGTSAAPINVDVKRFLQFEARGDFGLALGATGPNRLLATIGARGATGPDGSGTVTGGGIAMNVNNISDTAVSLQTLEITEVGPGGFKNVVNTGGPQIEFIVPTNNLGAAVNLVAADIKVPEGGTVATGSAGLPVTVQASGNLTVTSYERGGSTNPDSLGKTTQFTSQTGTMSLGTIVGNKDSITANAAGDVTISGSSVVTKGNVTVTSTTGDITLGLIDTTAPDPGMGAVTLSGRNIIAAVAGGAEEINAGGDISISASGLMGNAAAPLHVISPTSVSLTTTSPTARIGERTGVGAPFPLIAETPRLTINTAAGQVAAFLVDTLGTPLVDLLVTTVPSGGSVTSQATTYDFSGAGGNVTFAPNIDPAHFNNGTLSLTTTSGDVTLDTINMAPSASFAVHARGGSILGGESIDAMNVTLTAASEGANPIGGPAASIVVGDIGANVPVSNLTMTAGYRNDGPPTTSRSASVTTGTIATAPGGNVSITTFAGNIEVGAGTGPIGSGLAPAGTVNLTAARIGSGDGETGTIRVGDIFAQTLNLRGGKQDNPDGIQVGAVQAEVLTVDKADGGAGNTSFQSNGALTGIQSLTVANSRLFEVAGGITGKTGVGNSINVDSFRINIGGAVTAAPGQVSTIILNATSGALDLGPAGAGVITAGNGSTVELLQGDTGGPVTFGFATVDTGVDGSVKIALTNNDISQQAGGTGITAKSVELSSGTGIIGSTGALDLNSVKNLTLSSSNNVSLDANGSALESFSYTRGAASTFSLTGTPAGQTIAIGPLATATLNVDSTTLLNFTLANNAPAGGITTGNTGIITNGGFVNMTAAGGIDATTGGINTTGAGTPNGYVVLRANGGSITTGTITTPETALSPTSFVDAADREKAISITTNCASCGIVVNGTLQSGTPTAGGPISLRVLQSGNIAQTGGLGILSASPNSVFVSTADGNIGTDALNRLAITSPNVTLFAGTSAALGTAPGATEGNVFATLTDTTTLNLSGANGFDVTSTSPFDVLSVATRGSGDGSKLLTATNQSYSFDRPATDLFGAASPATFEVITAAGASPATSATFSALDGNLLVRGGASLSSPNLTLQALAADGDLKLQGNDAAPLILTNAGVQTFSAGRHVEVGRKATITGGTQTISSTNGNVTFSGGAVAGEAVNVSASVQQHIFTAQTTGGNVVFQAGSAAGTSVTAAFSGAASGAIEQLIEAKGEVQVRGGSGGTAGNPAFALLTSNQDQLVRAGNRFGAAGTVLVLGGSADGATAQITATGAGNQQVGESRQSCCSPTTDFDYQTLNVMVQGGANPGANASIRNSGTGTQYVLSRFGTVSVLGGSGTDTVASIENTGAGEQHIGISGFFDFGNHMNNLLVRGGSGTGAHALVSSLNSLQMITADSQITLSGVVDPINAFLAAGTNASSSLVGGAGQRIQGGNLTMTAGVANGTDVLIQSTGDQGVNVSTLILAAGGGPGTTSTAQIRATGVQSVSGNSGTLTGGPGVDSIARIATSAGPEVSADNAEQSLSFSSLVMNGGTEVGSYVRIDSAGDQSLSGGNWTLNGGTATGTFAKIDAIAGSQSFFGNNLTLNAAGTAAAPVGGAGAIIEGLSQSISAGALLLNGGAGTAGNVSDARLTDLAGDVPCVFSPCAPEHGVFASTITLNGGFFHSTTGILNMGPGRQTVSGSSGVMLTGNAVGPGADVLISNPNATRQVIQASSGGIRLDNTGSGLVSIASGGTQQTTSRFVDIVTSAGSSGNSTLTSTDNQWIRTTNGTSAPVGGGSLRVASRGSGLASVDSGARQLLEIDYPEVMTAAVVPPGNILVGATDAVGTSQIQALEQLIFARKVTVQGGQSTGTGSKLTGPSSHISATNAQTISVLDGELSVLGGSGVNSVATIDPVTQTAIVNGNINVTGGSASGALASIVGTTQTLIATKGTIAVTSGSSGNANIHSDGTQQLDGNVAVLGAGANTSALIDSVGNQTINANTIMLTGGANPNAVARITTPANQTLTFNSLLMNTGAGSGSSVMIDTAGTQLLTSNGGNIALNANTAGTSAIIQGHSQTLACVGSCNVNLSLHGGASDAQIINLSGDQNISAGTIFLAGGLSSTTGILNQGGGTQSVSSLVGGIALDGDVNASGIAKVLIQNVPETLQTITATGDVSLNSRGAGTVAITSAGSQVIEARGLDVLTDATGAGGANATVSAAGDQTIHTRGALAAEPGVGMRVASLSTGTAKVLSGANQVLNIGHPELVQGQLLIGRLAFGPPGLGNSGFGFPAVGDSLVLATNALTPGLANQTVRAGSVYIQGPSGDLRVSKLSADATQNVTTFVGGVSIIGGSGTDAFAIIDPTNQNVTSFGNLLLQGGSGPNADALINATGPQSVFSQNGSVTLLGGSGTGADALIATTSPFQSVSGANGLFLLQGPPGGGFAFLQQGSNLAASQIAANNLTNELLREQDHLDELRDEALSGEEEENRLRRRAQLCS